MNRYAIIGIIITLIAGMAIIFILLPTKDDNISLSNASSMNSSFLDDTSTIQLSTSTISINKDNNIDNSTTKNETTRTTTTNTTTTVKTTTTLSTTTSELITSALIPTTSDNKIDGPNINVYNNNDSLRLPTDRGIIKYDYDQPVEGKWYGGGVFITDLDNSDYVYSMGKGIVTKVMKSTISMNCIYVYYKLNSNGYTIHYCNVRNIRVNETDIVDENTIIADGFMKPGENYRTPTQGLFISVYNIYCFDTVSCSRMYRIDPNSIIKFPKTWDSR